MNKQLYSQAFTLFLFIILLSSFAYSQQQNKLKSCLSVTVYSSQPSFTEIQKQVLEYCQKELESKNLLKSDMPDWVLLLNAEEINNPQDDLIIISVTTLSALPKEIIDFCSQNEVFNTVLLKNKKKELPEEGKSIREYITSEFMSEFHQICGSDMCVTNQAKLKSTCKEIIEKFLSE